MTTRRRVALALVGGVLLIGTAAHLLTADPIPESRGTAPVVFVCRNGVAMSLWSAAYFNRLATKRGLPQWAVARAAIPSFSDVPLNMTVALAIDGFRVAGYRPQVVSADDVRHAELVVAIDTDLPPEALDGDTPATRWDGFPPMREEYFPSRAALKARVEALVERFVAASRSNVRSSPDSASRRRAFSARRHPRYRRSSSRSVTGGVGLERVGPTRRSSSSNVLTS